MYRNIYIIYISKLLIFNYSMKPKQSDGEFCNVFATAIVYKRNSVDPFRLPTFLASFLCISLVFLCFHHFPLAFPPRAEQNEIEV